MLNTQGRCRKETDEDCIFRKYYDLQYTYIFMNKIYVTLPFNKFYFPNCHSYLVTKLSFLRPLFYHSLTCFVPPIACLPLAGIFDFYLVLKYFFFSFQVWWSICVFQSKSNNNSNKSTNNNDINNNNIYKNIYKNIDNNNNNKW